MSPATSPATHLIPASAARPGDDPIFALNAEATRRAQGGEDVLNATLGALIEDDGQLAVMASVFEAMGRIPPRLAASYAPISGPTKYLNAILDDLYAGSPLRDSAVAVGTPGGTGALYSAIVNFLEPGQKLLTTSFYWSPYAILADHARRDVATFRMFAGDGSFDLDSLQSELAALMRAQGRALVVLNTPCHNPTGFSLDEDEWSALVAILLEAEKAGPVTLLLDLAYEKFARPDSPAWRPHVERLVNGGVPVLVAWTASKAFTQYGGRIGALVAAHGDAKERERYKNALGYSCRGTWSNCNHLGMQAVGTLLTDGALRQKSLAEREALRDLLDRRVVAFNREAARAGLAYPRYEGGFFVCVFCRDSAEVVRATQARGVFVVPLPGAVRVALCSTPEAQVPRLVDALAAAGAAG
ncbi:MAG: aminotransferase class I/II-fold pyridoxal phosphate-dependent enzyme [Planctomycetaceae bacterium]|nr:aminotransferase class I/II-fold pyridoxal phosphate-dependent enzyme [Planctomycetaceae bacterium]